MSLNVPVNQHRFSWFSTINATLDEIFPVIFRLVEIFPVIYELIITNSAGYTYQLISGVS